MSELRSEAYKRYSLGYSAIKPDPEQFKKYILSNFPKDKCLIDNFKASVEGIKS